MSTPSPEPAAPPAPRRGVRWMKRVTGAMVGLALGSAVSCMHIPRHNPAYPATTVEVRAALREMRRHPTGLDRPVLVLSGYRSPAGAAIALERDVERLTGAPDDRVAHLSYFWADDIEPLGDRVVAFVDEAWPTDDPDRTTEVDVVAISMGGIVARWAAAERSPGARRLNIATLYTLATPHRGAVLSDIVRPDKAAAQLMAGSPLLSFLDDELTRADYEIVPYAVLHDWMVGATRTAPPGQEPIWVPGRVGLAHHLVSRDQRILADLGRRLRAEPPPGAPSEPPRD